MKDYYWIVSTYALLFLVAVLTFVIVFFDTNYNFNENLEDCLKKSGNYAFSIGNEWNYETCTIEETIRY